MQQSELDRLTYYYQSLENSYNKLWNVNTLTLLIIEASHTRTVQGETSNEIHLLEEAAYFLNSEIPGTSKTIHVQILLYFSGMRKSEKYRFPLIEDRYRDETAKTQTEGRSNV